MATPAPKRGATQNTARAVNRIAPGVAGGRRAGLAPVIRNKQLAAVAPAPAGGAAIEASGGFYDPRTSWVSGFGDPVRLTDQWFDDLGNLSSFVDIDPDIYAGTEYNVRTLVDGFYQMSGHLTAAGTAGTLIRTSVHCPGPGAQAFVTTDNTASSRGATATTGPVYCPAMSNVGVQVYSTANVTVSFGALSIVKFA